MTNVKIGSYISIRKAQRWRDRCLLLGDAQHMAVTTVFAVFSVLISCVSGDSSCNCRVGVKLIHLLIAMRVPHAGDIRSAIEAHEEHGEHNDLAKQASQHLISVT